MIKCDHHPGSGHKASVGSGHLARRCLQELGVNVACLGDLQGPKFRVGELLGNRKPGRVQYPGISWLWQAFPDFIIFLSSSLFNMIHHWSCQTILKSLAVDGSCFLGAMAGENISTNSGPVKSQHYLNIGRAWLWCGEIASAAEVGSWSHSLEEWWRFGVRKLERAQLVGVLRAFKGQTSQLQSEPDSFIGSNPILDSPIETHGLGMARYVQIWEDVQDIYPQPSLVIEEFARTTTTRSSQGASPWNLPSSRTLAADGDFGGGNHQDLGIQDVKASQIGMQ
jgi:hypothetical protein